MVVLNEVSINSNQRASMTARCRVHPGISGGGSMEFFPAFFWHTLCYSLHRKSQYLCIRPFILFLVHLMRWSDSSKVSFSLWSLWTNVESSCSMALLGIHPGGKTFLICPQKRLFWNVVGWRRVASWRWVPGYRLESIIYFCVFFRVYLVTNTYQWVVKYLNDDWINDKNK